MPTVSGKTGGTSVPPPGRVNTIGLADTALAQLLEMLDRAGGDARRVQRDFVRWPFRKTRVRVRFAQGATPELALACRNISRGGIALLHNRYMHQGTPVTVMLPLPGGGERPTPGRIARCTHRSGVIHEVGIEFTSAVNVRELIAPTPLPDFLTLERIDPESLRGFILCITASDADARIVRHFLRFTQLAIRTATTAAEAVSLLQDPFCVVIADLDSPELADGRFAAPLRIAGCRAPLIAITSNAAAAGPAIAASGADAVLTKPLSQDRLLRCVGEYQLASAQAVQPTPALR